MKRFSLMILGLFAMIGCSSEVKGPEVVTVRGTVKVDGQPVSGARVTFIPLEPKLNPVNGATKASGEYELYYGSRVGAPPGDYKVTVSYYTLPDGKPYEPKEGELDIDQLKMQGKVVEAIAPQHSDPAKSELKVTIPAGGKTDANFDVVKAKK